MNCWECNRPANGICQFCGRAVCKSHFKERLHVVSVFSEGSALKSLVTKKVLFCGKCLPIGDPVDLSEKDKEPSSS